MYNYSIIIPHTNLPELLERCLASIPQRDDTEIILVDDNSDPARVDFANFPGSDRPDVKLLLSKNEDGRWGAGVSRNRALDMATGRWVVFVDSDDFLLPSAAELMDKYRDHEADMVYLGNTFVDTVTLEPVTHIKISQMDNIEEYLTTGNDEGLRYRMNAPWGKLFRRAFLDDHDIRFSEVRCCEDMIVSIRAGHLARTIECDRTPFYCYTWREGALSSASNRTVETMFTELCEDIKVARFLHSMGRIDAHHNIALHHWKGLMRRDRRLAKQFLPQLREVYPERDVRRMVRKMRFDPLVAPFRKLLAKWRMKNEK
jgi:glycosyltransferase involved in cell wall biosynthesis